jgi:hypothetical protein
MIAWVRAGGTQELGCQAGREIEIFWDVGWFCFINSSIDMPVRGPTGFAP